MAKKSYESPRVTAIGSISGDTLANKDYGLGDAALFQGEVTCVDEGCQATSA